ncbi:MAG: DNA-formamidopyrimidine glycosylase [Minisyncoccia bacterium]
MPELAEVETIIRQLEKEIINKKIEDVFCFAPVVLKNIPLSSFKRDVMGQRIKKIERKGKNILIYLSNELVILIHLKLTGHLLIGKYDAKNNQLIPREERLKDPINRFIRLAFLLNDNRFLVLSDLRKFAKILLLKPEELEKELQSIGIDPLSNDFNLTNFKNLLTKKRGPIKKFLMDQKYISGIGNIYSSEILFEARIHPLKKIEKLTEEEIKNLYKAIKKVLLKAIKYQGTSAQDESYRNLYGEKGGYEKFLKVYQREGQKCLRCGQVIKRIKIDNRSAFFCPDCQKI